MRVEDLPLRADAVGTVARGHPWVYADALEGPRPARGTPVRLRDPRGRAVAFGLADEGPIAVRVLGRHPRDLDPLLRDRVAAADRLRQTVVPPDTDAYRLVNGAGDGLPGVVVDRYGPLAVLRLYGGCWEPWLPALTQAVARLDDVTTVVRRLGVRRVDGDEGLHTLSGPEPPEQLVVREHGLRFLVRPAAGQKTGLFLDQRDNRQRIRAVARDRDVIDVFSCTGGFAVYAAAGGARRVTVVDAAPAAVADARENLRLNGVDPDRHAFVVADAFAWEPSAPAELVVCDPPSLTHGRKADRAARRRYAELATRYGRATAPGGLLATASCTARLSFERWEQAVRDGLRKAGRFSVLARAGEPPDHPVLIEHPEGRYLKFALLLKRSDGRAGRRAP